ncbi:MAG: porphobilinogen synthase [Actinomycetota bacterium]|nr:porphobilinogen synthase [Actinomycetota bacterium]
MPFPVTRPRRLRRTPALRRLVAENRLAVDDLVAPIFVRDGISEAQPIAALPGVVQHTVTSAVEEVAGLAALGVCAVMLFGVPESSRKDAEGSAAWDPDGVVPVTLQRLRDRFGGNMVLMADLCLDEYTDHGHCGVVDARGAVDNDATLERYALVARTLAAAGTDVVAPSGMMDGQVRAIRSALDGHGFADVAILAYAAKYASALYGPFRDAVDVALAEGQDRRGYQMDPANLHEALVEVALDVAEGADMVMVKPALTYLDVIRAVRESVAVPVAAFQVSGEYAMVRAGADRGWIDGDAVAMEQTLAVKRAGADVVITYFAAEIARALGA